VSQFDETRHSRAGGNLVFSRCSGSPLSRGRQKLRHYPWIVRIDNPPIPRVIQAWDLGDSESAVLAWAYPHPGTEAIIDDLAGRRCAAALGIPVRGTFGLVLTAKGRGRITKARAVIERLRQAGMYLSALVMNQALTLVGEWGT